MLFEDRADAGQKLAALLQHYAGRPDVVVLALPRGGVPVGYQVAQALRAPLDVFVVRKLGVPGHEELAMGAVASGGVRVLNPEIVEGMTIPEWAVDAVTRSELQEIQRRERAYRDAEPPIEVAGRVVILIDDGLATGATMRAAVRALRTRGPARIVVAVPVAASASCNEFRAEADEIVCAYAPESFFAVGQWYRRFDQITDDEVRHLLRLTRRSEQQPRAA